MVENIEVETPLKELAGDEYIYTNEELENISDLGSVLQKIHQRLVSKGYSISQLRKQLESELALC